MKKLKIKLFKLFSFLLIITISYNIYSKENPVNEEDRVTIESVKDLGIYKPITKFPKDMKAKFDSSCIEIICFGRKAGKEVYFRFVTKKKSMGRYPGKMMEAMAWYEVLYMSNLKKNDFFIKRYLANEGKDYKDKKIDENSIKSLLSMNKGRENMRNSLGMDLETPLETALQNFWVMGEFLGQGKNKKIKVNKTLLKRKKILTEYKNKVNLVLQKIEDNNKDKNININEEK